MTKAILIFCFSLVATTLNANCDFSTVDFLSEIDNPSAIKRIEINVPKSAKFNRNFAKILTSKTENIPPELKKKFKAKLTVRYDFGSCVYKAKVRQNGDWKDHIVLKNGSPVRSINVKLKEGNILNAVEFKLLIPETRNNLNEVLGSIILRKLGYIAPETFQVETSVNGVSSTMIFQENASKELLERNNRREGPLFEGDEELLWSFENYPAFSLESLALSRSTNPKWFLKGKSSQHITLKAYEQLQAACLEYTQQYYVNGETLAIYPNMHLSSIFKDYASTLFVMNGHHALRPHNRKYYYNVFSREFEPIYYDGNFSLQEPALLPSPFSGEYKFPHNDKLHSENFKEEVFNDFSSRVIIGNWRSKLFVDKSFAQIEENVKQLQEKSNNVVAMSGKYRKASFPDNLKKYLDRENIFKVEQRKISSVELVNDDYKVSDLNGQTTILSPKEIARVISRNKLKGKRTIYLAEKTTDRDIDLKTRRIMAVGGYAVYSKGLSLKVDKNKRNIMIKQDDASDWILFKGVNLDGWTLSFDGAKAEDSRREYTQRFNKYGMTGCLNLYRSKFNNTKIYIKEGMCEDSLNIIDSTGSIKEVKVEKAYADGVDIDFSSVSIESLEVNTAGNDCLDVSGGIYSLDSIKLKDCRDKGISVGEKSKLTASTVLLDQASLGDSSKDSSIVNIASAKLTGVLVCAEAVQKKQEFGGASAIFGSLDCKGEILVDKNSIITRGAE